MKWLFDIDTFVTRSVPESESENPLEVLQHEQCVTFRAQIK